MPPGRGVILRLFRIRRADRGVTPWRGVSGAVASIVRRLARGRRVSGVGDGHGLGRESERGVGDGEGMGEVEVETVTGARDGRVVAAVGAVGLVMLRVGLFSGRAEDEGVRVRGGRSLMAGRRGAKAFMCSSVYISGMYTWSKTTRTLLTLDSL